MLMFALCAMAAQTEGPAVAVVTRRPDLLPSPPDTVDWREFFLPRLPEDVDDLLPDGDVERAPLDLRVEDVALARLREIQEQPVLFPTISRIAFAAPAFLIEGLTALTMPDRVIVGNQRIFDRGTGEDDLAWLFGRTLVKRQTSFLAGLGDSYLATPGVESGQESPDQHRYDRLQQKVFFDSFKRAYRERYQIPSLELDTVMGALSSGSWVDYIVLPGLFSAYTAKYGLDRKFRIGEDVRIELSVEKGTRFYKVATQDHGGRLAAVAVNLFNLPVSAIVSIDSLENGIGFGFIGIGTDLDAVIEAMYSARPDSLRAER